MTRIHSFPPMARRDARVLVLGSIPGAASLAAGQYYAHPRNAFWPIMGRLLGFAPSASYAERAAALRRARVAVWDVIESCIRPGSLDGDIRPPSVRPNDFTGFFREHPLVHTICFNGGQAEACFRRYVTPHLATRGIRFLRLPSTSPAHAALTFKRKLAAWHVGLSHRLHSLQPHC